MSEFKFLSSLIAPPPIVENVVPPQPEQPAAPQPDEGVEIQELEIINGPDSDGTCELAMTISYAKGDDFAVEFGVNAHLTGEYNVEDNSFDHEFGTQKQIDVTFDGLKLSNIVIPHEPGNMELLKLQPELVRHISDMTKKYLSSIGDDEIGRHINIDKLTDKVAAQKSRYDY